MPSQTPTTRAVAVGSGWFCSLWTNLIADSSRLIVPTFGAVPGQQREVTEHRARCRGQRAGQRSEATSLTWSVNLPAAFRVAESWEPGTAGLAQSTCRLCNGVAG